MRVKIESLLIIKEKFFRVLFLKFLLVSSLAFGQFNDNTPAPLPGIETFTVPANVTSIRAEVWGSGGSGGGSTTNKRSGSGGGGGGYTTRTFDVLAGQTITYTVGAGAIANLAGADGIDGNLSNLTHAPSATTLVGNGGGRGNANSATGGIGGTGTGGANISGSNGGAGNSNIGGNGGDGGNAPGTGGTGQSNNDGLTGVIPGGGGGGGERGGGFRAGGAGANGQITLTYISVSNVSPSPVCVGSTITITGTNFATTGSTTVSINGTACTVTGVTSTTITAVVAAGTTSGTVLVTNPNGTNNGRSLTINASPSAIGGGASTVCTGSVSPAFTNAVGGGTWSISNGTGSATITAGGVVTGVSTGSATVVYTIGTCTASFPITVLATPVISTNPSNVSVAAGANTSFTVAASYTPNAYTWQVSTDAGASWTTISNGGVYSNATTATLNITGATLGMSGYLYRASATNNCGTSAYSSNAALTVTYCTPNITTPSTLYIREFQFVGVLNNPPAKTSTYSTGYEDWTSFTPIAQQPQNTAMNIVAKTNGTSGGSWKAWVDWNRDGDFNDTGEEVYKMTTFTTPAVTFGFIIPSTVLGNYRLRIATSSTSKLDGTYDFSPCSVLSEGEFEDYLFNVVADCPAKVVRVNKVNTFDGERCGPGSVRLSAEGTASAVSFNWYDYDPNTNAYTYLATGTTYLTPSISSTKTYYVKAITNTDTSAANYCETPFYYPVVARIDPNPTVTFSKSKPAICGEDDPSLLVTAAGDRFQDVIFESFDSNLGQFNGNVTDAESIYTNAKAEWLNKPTPYIPLVAEGYEGLSPAMSSGYFGGNFAMINSDIDRNTNIKYQLISNNSTNPNKLLNVNGYLNLQLDFDLYHFSIAKNNTQGYIEVSYTLDASVSSPVWVSLALPGYTVADASVEYPNRYWVDMGNPLKWQHFSITIPGSNFTSDKFAIRFIHFSSGNIGAGQKFYEAITAVDNVRLSGFKTINTPFKWNSAATTIYDTNCVTPLSINDTRSTVCVKPSATELEDVNWALNASATFSNGCPAIGNFTVDNDTKTWRQPGITDWNQGAQWRPSTVPTINKCVIVRTPVELPTNTNGSHGLARSVIVKPGGSLIIQPKSSLTIQNHIKNETAPSDVLVKSDANLIQFNDAAANSGNITVQRNSKMKRLDYTYWGSPVSGQKLRSFSPATLNTRFYVYNEANDYFDGIFVKNTYPTNGMYPTPTLSLTPVQPEASYDFEKAKGYAVRSPNNFTTSVSDFMGNFVGTPNNGVITININKSLNTVIGGNTYVHGINLISNPYPSNIDLDKFFVANPSLEKVARFWTNINPNPAMQGSGYPNGGFINNYAFYNIVGGLPAPGPACEASPSKCSPTPTNIVKVGQGFLVHVASSVAPGTNNIPITFNNSIRSATNSGSFFNGKIANATKDRYWLELKTPLDFVTPLLVGYVEGSTNAYDEDYDVELNVIGADSFYTILDNKKLGIQGRKYPVNTEDVVSLGAIFHETGMYMISLTNKEGVFANGQEIYLRDNLLGVVANLSKGAYSFSAQAGEVNNRFEILYNYRSLGTDTIDKAGFTVYKEGNDFVIKANETIKAIKIYDASGKLIYKFNANSKEHRVDATKYQSGVYMIDITTSSKSYNKKIIK